VSVLLCILPAGGERPFDFQINIAGFVSNVPNVKGEVYLGTLWYRYSSGGLLSVAFGSLAPSGPPCGPAGLFWPHGLLKYTLHIACFS
jgi:hypothetical protein